MDDAALIEAAAALGDLRRTLADALNVWRERKYSPDQPRVPAGTPDGGQWTDSAPTLATMEDGVNYHWTPGDGLSLTPAANKRTGPPWNVDIAKEDAAGGHTQERHVGLSNSELIAAVKAKDYSSEDIKAESLEPVGSFNSLAEANMYVNNVIQSNPDQVAAVADGRLPSAFLNKRFSSPTGREALRSLDFFGPEPLTVRPTFSVGVLVKRSSSGKGFFVRTAFPMNNQPDAE